MSAFSETLKYLREQQKLKQEDIGTVIGKSRETITKYENDRAEPDLKTLVKLADHFGVSVDFLTGSSKNNNLLLYIPT
jgi:transcriptional regulator with XRE-family HTH domain